MTPLKANPTFDLVLQREIAVKPELVWAAWTMPEHVVKWFTPKPWGTKSCEIDLRPGGKFNTVMLSPDGQEFANSGCILEVVTNRRLVFTDTLLEGWRPAPKPFFTGAVEIEPTATGSRYTATAIHGDEETRKKHEEMGFHGGWSTALDQLVAWAMSQ